MFPLRLKMDPSRNGEWYCFFCIHVRTATVLLGIWHLILHVLALSVLAIIMRNHQQLMAEQQTTPDYIEPNNLLPTPLSKVKDNDNPYFLPTTQDGRTPYSSDMDMGALMTVCTLAITLLLVYGTLKGRATHLLPFFCLQLFDFAITTLTATGYFCYLRSVHSLVADHWQNLPFRKELLQLSPQYLSLIVLVAFLVSMLWKAYCIGIVWRCYKFLTLRKQAMRSTVHYILPEGSDRLPEPDYSSLLPDYEAACASVLKQPPPPSYAVAMSFLPPAYTNPQIVGDLASNNNNDSDNNNSTTESNQVIPTAIVENENKDDEPQPQGNTTPTAIVGNTNAVNVEH
ncbi:hypothetical protein FQA39_LY03595 [Lamprigera yunnana]|nr:hypothetical protein FQA39_LY03595 [Lamprigera yunnana]